MCNGNDFKNTTYIRKYAQGHASLLAVGSAEYTTIAEECMDRASRDVTIAFNKGLFIQEMRDKKVPEEEIKKFVDSINIDDETYLVRKAY